MNPSMSPGPLSKGTVEVIGDSYFSANNAQLYLVELLCFVGGCGIGL